jgi:hypothetical protein
MMFTPKSTDAPGVVGEEYTISIDYLNKGKGEISNVRAELLGDIESTQTVQNLGNFEAGKSGTINFIVTPTEEGETPVSIKVTYEDANMEEKERVFNFNIKAEASQDDYDLYDGLDETEDEDAGTPIKKIIGFAAAGVVALLAIIIAVVKIKKRKAKKDSIKVDWED